MYAEEIVQPLDTETSQQGQRLRFGHLTPLLTACLMFIIFVAVSIASSTSGDSYSCSSIIFLFLDAGEYYSLLPLLKYFRLHSYSVLGIVIDGGTAPPGATQNNQDVILLSKFIPEAGKGLVRNETFKDGKRLAQLLARDQRLGQAAW